MHIFAYVLVILSGMTGLIYQVLWQKQLSNLFGSHQLATSLVLATFFGFMALGYHFLGRWISTSKKNRIWLYGLLEGGIGVYALVSPFWYFSLTQYYQMMIHVPGSNVWGPIAFAVFLMGLPTFLMGGTIPVLVEGLSQTFDVSHKTHSRIYSLNTLGAFLGTVFCGFWLLESFGIDNTLYLSGLLNVAIFACTFKFRKKSHKNLSIAAGTTKKDSSTRVLFFLSFMSGFYVFGLENLVIRMAGVSMGSTVYTYTLVVACFILAIAFGAVVANRFKSYPSLKLLWIVTTFLFLSTAALYLSIPYWPEFFFRVRLAIQPGLMNFPIYWAAIFLVLFLVLLLPVAIMGMNLPLLFFYLKGRKQFLSQTIGSLYAFNSLGSVLGAFIGGYVLFNWLDAPSVFKIMLLCIVACLCALALLPESSKFKNKILVVSLVASILIFAGPSWKVESFSPGLFNSGSSAPPDTTFKDWIQRLRKDRAPTVFEKYDVNTLVTVTKDQRNTSIYVNGKPDAATSGDFLVRGLNIVIPLMVSTNIDDVFIIGLGGGLSLGISTKFSEVKSVELAELSKGVIDALPHFNEHSYDVLSRKNKFTIFNDDAFSVLNRGQKKYNLIVSEPSNPWISGVEKLYSLDFLQMASQKLAPGGFYVQWFPLFQTTTESFLMVLNNFNETFPWTSVWTTSAGVSLILASNEVPSIDPQKIEKRFAEQKDLLKDFGIQDPYSVFGRQLLTPLFTRGLPYKFKGYHTLNHPKLAYQAGRALVSNFPFVDIQKVIEQTIPNPPPKSVKGADFLFEDEKIKLSKTFFSDNFTFGEKVGLKDFPGTAFHYKRLRFEYLKRFPESSPAYLNFQKYLKLIDGKEVIDATSDKETKAKIWKNLIPMQIRTDSTPPAKN